MGVIVVLGTLAWVSSYYLPAILADRIANDLSISGAWHVHRIAHRDLAVADDLAMRAGNTGGNKLPHVMH